MDIQRDVEVHQEMVSDRDPDQEQDQDQDQDQDQEREDSPFLKRTSSKSGTIVRTRTYSKSKSMTDMTDKRADEQRKSKTSEWLEMDGGLHGMTSENGDGSHQQSRFHVAKVSDENGEDEYQLSEAGDAEGNGVCSPVGSATAQRTLGNTNTYYDTKNLKSLRYYTREALPRVDHYRNILSVHGHLSRPTLDELHGGQGTIPYETNKSKHQLEAMAEGSAEVAVKFGWIQGVLVRCLLNIWGVMLFLRLSWVVANAGIGLACMVVILASVVTTITALSMSAICTNGEVKGGGTYYMISRSLGPEFGGSIGLIFALANAVAIAMYTVGFAETLYGVLQLNGANITHDQLNDIRIISCITVVFLLGIAIIGTEWESKAQMVLLVILLIAMVDFLIGAVLNPSDEQKSRGFIGWNENFGPNFRKGENFFSVFAIFFPAATGILAGANISGDLKDPGHAIPLGTLLAIAITTASYLLFTFVAGAVVMRDANGLVDIFSNENYTSDVIAYIRDCNLTDTRTCTHGSHNYFQVMEMVAAFGPIIYAGIFAATLSSALASLVSAPKVFQALCKDKLFPFIEFFGKGYGKNNEPRRGYLLAFVIAVACCAIGDLNLIAPIISNFFLAAYCLINFSCFHASFAKSLGFRPSFRYYNMWASLAGAILCLVVMFIMDWQAALATFSIVFGLYIWVLYRKPDVNWGSSTQAQTYRSAVQSVYKLNCLPDHVKNYRPQILVLSGNPSTRPPIVDFAYSISKGIGLLVCGHAAQEPLSQRSRNANRLQANDWLQKRKVKAFYNLIEEESFSRGIRAMIQSVGIGKLRPNLVIMGFKHDWQTCDTEEVLEFFNVIHDTFDKHLSLAILRVHSGLDFSKYGRLSEIAASFEEKPSGGFLNTSFVSIELSKAESEGAINAVSRVSRASSISSRESSPPTTPNIGRLSKSQGVYHVSQDPGGIRGPREIPKDVMLSANQFQRKQKKGTIDVWWLFDDGGLTMLIPYIISTRKQWAGCKLRIFALANRKDELDREQRNMAALLNKFRIDYSDVTVIPGIVRPPQESSRRQFDEVISKWRIPDNDSTGNGSGNGSGPNEEPEPNLFTVSDSEVLALKDKTNRHLRLRELLGEHSRDASLVVMTLPMPRKGTVSAPMYMAWLEVLTKNMPPFLLIRGNQSSVLTFYS